MFLSTPFDSHLDSRNNVFLKVFNTYFEGFDPRKKSFFFVVTIFTLGKNDWFYFYFLL